MAIRGRDDASDGNDAYGDMLFEVGRKYGMVISSHPEIWPLVLAWEQLSEADRAAMLNRARQVLGKQG